MSGLAVGYLRVSTEGQVGEDKFGLPVQRQAIQEYAHQHGLHVVCWHGDEGITGATLDRPGLKDMLDRLPDLKQQGLEFVLVAKMDRLARDLMAQLWIEKELLRHGVELVSVAEPFRGQDPANVLFRQIIGAFAQFEKARIADRLSAGKRLKASQGGFAGGPAPLGYRTDPLTKCLEVDEDKVPTVRRVFDLREEHPDWTLDRIASVLNQEGHTTAKGKPFGKVQVKRILDRRELYAGLYRYAGLQAPGKHQAIIS